MPDEKLKEAYTAIETAFYDSDEEGLIGFGWESRREGIAIFIEDDEFLLTLERKQ